MVEVLKMKASTRLLCQDAAEKKEAVAETVARRLEVAAAVLPFVKEVLT